MINMIESLMTALLPAGLPIRFLAARLIGKEDCPHD